MIVADTHAWIWWLAEPTRLSARARRALSEANAIGVAAISLWEVAMLVQRGRLKFDREVSAWLRQALVQPKIEVLPLDADVAADAAELGDDFPGDHADRLIAATALCHGSPLVTRDARLRERRELRTIW